MDIKKTILRYLSKKYLLRFDVLKGDIFYLFVVLHAYLEFLQVPWLDFYQDDDDNDDDNDDYDDDDDDDNDDDDYDLG